MENILIFCIVMLAIGLKALVDKPKKEAEGQQPDEAPSPAEPLYEPLQQAAEPASFHQPKRRKKHSRLPEEGLRSTPPFASAQAGCDAAPTMNAPLPEAGCEFANPSPEELRRAVIWSEILQRKY